MKIILIFLSFAFGQLLKAQVIDDEERVQQAVITWADSTFFSYDEPRFEQFVPHYTDEYRMASMRVESIEKSIARLKNTKEKGTYRGTDQEFENTLKELEMRKTEAEANNQDFRPKVTHYSIVFWANIKLDSGIYNYVRHDVELNDSFRVTKSMISGNIGDNSKGSIIYR
jgi:hypothetical protein